jgi:hypothetical protein
MVEQWVREFDLLAVLEQLFPTYEVVLVPDSDFATAIGQVGKPDRICIGFEPFDLDVSSAHEFITHNHDCLVVSMGELNESSLRESAISGVTNDPDVLHLWRRLTREAKAAMHQGAWIRNPTTDARSYERAHLHTQGAHGLAQHGVTMLAAAGWNEYEFEDLVG